MLRRYIYLRFMAPWPYMANLIIHNRKRIILWLQRTRGRLELTVQPYFKSSYLRILASFPGSCAWERGWLPNGHRYADKAIGCGGRLIASWWWCETASHFLTTHTLSLHWFMILCPAELSHYGLYRKPHETVTDNSPLTLHSEKRGQINKLITIIQAPPPCPHTCS